jgi:TatD DNase family protein
MIFVDTHTHIYLDAFDNDREEMISRAHDAGVRYLMLPDIDSGSRPQMLRLANQYPDSCFPMAGLHPTSVKENYLDALEAARALLVEGKVAGIGECGMDLYWDLTYVEAQKDVFETQLKWSLEHELPVSIHIRDAFEAVFEVLERFGDTSFKGVFHCFTGGIAEAERALKYGFHLGIGGIVTFKKSPLPAVLSSIDPERVVLESDAPFLAPTPYRGKRNEPAYLPLVAEKLGEIWQMPLHQVAEITTYNAMQIFNLPEHA